MRTGQLLQQYRGEIVARLALRFYKLILKFILTFSLRFYKLMLKLILKFSLRFYKLILNQIFSQILKKNRIFLFGFLRRWFSYFILWENNLNHVSIAEPFLTREPQWQSIAILSRFSFLAKTNPADSCSLFSHKIPAERGSWYWWRCWWKWGTSSILQWWWHN